MGAWKQEKKLPSRRLPKKKKKYKSTESTKSTEKITK